MAGKLILCATPIGNLDDASPRLGAALEQADAIYAEDTRRSRVLLRHLGVDKRLRSYFAGNEADRSVELERRLRDGATVALLTDAGTPSISDPGFSAVRAARAAGCEVTIVPGPSAVTAALAISGLPAERFAFEGFLPRRPGPRARRLDELAREPRTLVLFASPGRLADELADLTRTCGEERPVAVVRELTKAFEEVWTGTLGDAVSHWVSAPRGEVTLVVGGASSDEDGEEALERLARLMAQGVELSAAVRTVAAETGVRRNWLYEAGLGMKDT